MGFSLGLSFQFEGKKRRHSRRLLPGVASCVITLSFAENAPRCSKFANAIKMRGELVEIIASLELNDA